MSLERQVLLVDCGAEKLTQVRPGLANGVAEYWMNVDGARMRYLRAGSGPALVLVHGLLGYSFSWRYVMPALAPYFTVYAPDMLGAGFSDRAPSLDYSMSAVARRLVHFVTNLNIASSTFDLLGTSHGGTVAIMAAADCLHVDSTVRVRRLVLVAPANPFSAHGRRRASFFGSSLGASLFRHSIARMPFLFRFGHRRLYATPRNIPEDALEGYMAQLAVPGLFEHALQIVRTWTRDLKRLEDLLPSLGTIPTLLVWGADDPAVYASSAEPLSKYFLHSKTVVFPHVGHLPYEECPADFNRVLLEFLKPEPTSAVEI
ncbi:MAG TPA: alpha/beta hydrolase [Candidatus Sulfotelmatobacter sp.]